MFWFDHIKAFWKKKSATMDSSLVKGCKKDGWFWENKNKPVYGSSDTKENVQINTVIQIPNIRCQSPHCSPELGPHYAKCSLSEQIQ